MSRVHATYINHSHEHVVPAIHFQVSPQHSPVTRADRTLHGRAQRAAVQIKVPSPGAKEHPVLVQEQESKVQAHECHMYVKIVDASERDSLRPYVSHYV